ncbi:MAG: hypothetical protein ACI9R3_001054 [Verrucomicrobiales bacterium]|jgi:hypothetical protein
MKYLALFLSLLVPLPCLAAPIISEFMASNSEAFRDGDGQFSDWVEIHNPDDVAVNMDGWFLTDSAGNLSKWPFPATEIPAKGYLLVICSGNPVAGYVDGDGLLHADFRLSSVGEFLGLVNPQGEFAAEFAPAYPEQFNDVAYGSFRSGGGSEDLVSGSTLQWLVPTDDSLEATWNATVLPGDTGFIDGSGTGVGFESTPGSFVPFIDTPVESMQSVNASIYIRYRFTIPSERNHTSLKLSMRYDDGFIAYLNGVEIASRNAPEDAVWNAVATASHRDSEAEVFEDIDVSDHVGLLRPGADNVLAIQGMNTSVGGSDFLIMPQLSAQFEGDGPLETGYLASATPGAANANQSAEPGPGIAEVTQLEERPIADQQLTISAKLTERSAPVETVTLYHRVQYEDEVAVLMTGDGQGTYSAPIPAGAAAGEMLRWRIVATDTATNETRAPLFLDQSGTKQSAEYYGTVVKNADDVTTQLPLFEWFTERESTAHSRRGARVTVFYEGQFYDNAFARQRGGATNGTVSQKFVFNNNEPLFVSDELLALKEINVNAQGSDASYLRQTLAFDTYARAGHQTCISFLMLMRANAGTDRVGVFIEQPDEVYLRRHGYAPTGGELYKFTQRSNLNPVFSDVTTGVERQNGDERDRSSAQALVDGLALNSSEERITYLFDNLDMPQILNYLALRSITQDADDVRKNFYMFHDTHTDGLWRMLPWDKDWTFGVTGDGGTHLRHPFFGDRAHAKQNANQWNRLFDVMFDEEVTQRMYLRRLKTLADTMLQHPDTAEEELLFEKWVEELSAAAAADLPRSANSAKSAVLRYFPARRNDLFGRYAFDGSTPLLPDSQSTMADIEIVSAEFDANTEENPGQFIKLINREQTEIDVSGWAISGAVRFTFPAGTVIARQGELFVSRSIAGFRSRTASPRGSEQHFVVGPFGGQLTSNDAQIVLTNDTGIQISTMIIGAGPSPLAGSLVISEIHYHPIDPHADAEFLELMNIGGSAVSLEGLQISEGVEFNFSGAAATSLEPGARLVVVADRTAFEAAYGSNIPIAGVFANNSRLANGGEDITIVDSENRIVLNLNFGDSEPWPAAADGTGPSLVRVNFESDASDPSSWKASSTIGGTPGTDEASDVFTGDPNADEDGDGIKALLEFALGTSDTIPNSLNITIERRSDSSLLLRYTRSSSAANLNISYESSIDLQTWTPVTDSSETIEAAEINRAAVTVNLMATGGGSQYVRIKVTTE